MSEDLLYFNGINGDTGSYDLDPMTAARLFDVLRGVDEEENIKELKYRVQWENEKHLGVVEGIDATKIEEAGWGVIFPADMEGKFVPAVKDALKPLLDLRREQAGDFFRIYEGVDALRPKENKGEFLVRHGVPPADAANPEKMPYYLLLVGDPEQIPYRFQSQLDVQYAVGRIHFETLQEYANYAASVVAAETGQVMLPKQAAFFSVMNPDDQATKLSTTKLMEPLLAQMTPELPEWRIDSYLRVQANKAQLAKLLGGDQTPALLFTASHGVPFMPGSERQIPHQGALLCGDWPGPNAWAGRGALTQDYYFAGDDLTSDANLLGMIAFFFACYGGGTPQHDDFPKPGSNQLNQIAAKPFVSRLPMHMLGREKGGALAVIGHVERAWGASFSWAGVEQTDVFKSTLRHMMEGKPVGSALEYFNSRYATWASELSTTLRDVQYGLQVEPTNIASMWTAHNDARGYAIIGDPAVRLKLAQDGDASQARPEITVQPATGAMQTPAPTIGTPPVEPVPVGAETIAGYSPDAPAEDMPPNETPVDGGATDAAVAGDAHVVASEDAITISTYTAEEPNADRVLFAQTLATPGSAIDTTVFGKGSSSNAPLLDLHKSMVAQALSSGGGRASSVPSTGHDSAEEEISIPIPPVEPPALADDADQAFLPQVTDFLWVNQARNAFNVSGQGMTVAVLDTGLNAGHIDFAGRVVAQVNFTPDNGGNRADATDGNGHGTNVGGIIVAGGNHTGMAPAANIIPIKVLPNTTSGDFAWIDSALQWVIDNRTAHNISAVCMSLGDSGNYTTDNFGFFATLRHAIRAKIQTLKAANVAVVIAAGNDYFRHKSQPGMSFPAIIHECISVGAIYDDDMNRQFSYRSGAKAFSAKRGQITPFSQRLHASVSADTSTDIFAPGAPITATGHTGPEASSTQSGTSQATPVVTGIILLLQEFYQRWRHELPTVDQLIRWLQEGGVPIFDGDDENDNVQHTNLTYTRVDALSALDAARREIQRMDLAEKMTG
ncbi:MAG: S8 family serine peptidase [Caldilineaceae bacterium]